MNKKTPGKPHSGETTAQSRMSRNPGPVGDEETLARMVFRPQHFNEGRIDVKFITVRDLRESGCSVDRKEICGEDDIQRRGKARANPPQTEYVGYAQIKAGEVRRITDTDGASALCVWEQALPENAAHAVIKMARGDYAKGKIREIREKLMAKMDMSCAPIAR